MKVHEFAEKTLELFEQFECMGDSSLDCTTCPMEAPDGGCMHLDVKRRVHWWVVDNG